MQFLCSLFLIATLFTSLQAMIPEDVEHAAQEAALSAAEKEKLEEQKKLSTAAQEIKEAGKQRELLRTQQKAAARLKVEPQETAKTVIPAVSNLSPEIRASIFSMIMSDRNPQKAAANTLQFLVASRAGREQLNNPDFVKNLIAQFAKTHTISTEQAGQLLHIEHPAAIALLGKSLLAKMPADILNVITQQLLTKKITLQDVEVAGQALRNLSNSSKRYRALINSTEFTNAWLQIIQTLKEDAAAEGKNIDEAKLAVEELRADSDEKLISLIYLGTENALDLFINNVSNKGMLLKFYEQGLSKIAGQSGETGFLVSAPHPMFVPLAHRMLQRKFNPDQFVARDSELRPMMNFALLHNNDPYVINLFLNAGANPTVPALFSFEQSPFVSRMAQIKPNIEAATENINDNTLQTINLLIKARADVKNYSGKALLNALQSNHKDSTKILETLLKNNAAATPEVIALSNLLQENPQKAFLQYPQQSMEMIKEKANFINQYASTFNKARARIGI